MNISTPENLDIGFVLSCAAIVFLMQAGFCLLESGMVRTKNSINVAVKNVLDCAITMLLFVSFGFSMMFGASHLGLIGDPMSLLNLDDPKMVSFLLFQLVFCSAATTIVSGAIAERVKLTTYLAIVLAVSGFVYPTFGHWAWGGALPGTDNGWLKNIGFIDWAGGSVVHVVGGFAALAAAQVVGKRVNIPRAGLTGGHSLTLAILGVFLLWFGWWGFNGGSGLSINANLPRIILVTNLGAVSGGLAAALYSRIKNGRIEVVPLIIGILSGLVSVTSACHVLSFEAAVIAGAIGAILALWASQLLRAVCIDDAVDAFPVHGIAGIWSVVAVGIFAPESELMAATRYSQIAIQCLGAISAASLSYFTVFVALRLLQSVTPLRVTAEEEKMGLNVVEHGAVNAVTDLVMEIDEHARTGDFSHGIKADSQSEVGPIADGYNRVIQRVQSEMSNHRETNRWLEEERLRMQSILDHAGVGIYQLDDDRTISSANARLLELVGYKSLSAIQAAQDFESEQLLPWQTLSDRSKLMKEEFERGVAIKGIESLIVDHDGNELWVLENIVPIRDQSGNLHNWLGTVHDITEQKQAAIAEIEIAKAKSQAKGDFLATMSHEIRTPLNGVIGMLDLLDASRLPTKEQNFVSIAKGSAGSLLSVINDILDFSKIEAGHMALEEIEFNLRDVIEQIAEQFAYEAHVKKLDMNCYIEDDLPHVLLGDPERLRQVIINLLGNAIKFTEEGEINLRVTRRGSVMRISVEDTGIGMEADTQKNLFESFTQADASTTRKFGGTGLGLAISNKIVNLMGGRIHVKSEVNTGSEFWFELEMAIASDEDVQQIDSTDLLERISQARVLVIDDNATNCEILSNQLSSWGTNVSICKEPTRAIERLMVAIRIGQPFDLVILDYCMPLMNGRDVAMAMRDVPDLSDTPIIMLSSNYELLSQEDMQKTRIFAAITKPARQSHLLNTVMNALARHQTNQSSATPKPSTEMVMSTNSTVHNSQSKIGSAVTLTESNAPTNSVLKPTSSQTQSTDVTDVLIVEDNEVNRLVAKKMLNELGLTTDFAVNGMEGVERVKSKSYRMVLMDGHMPIMDGWAATREIRIWERSQPKQHRSIPIIALTANVVEGVRRDCSDAGMDHYLCKPITLANIQKVVDKFLPARMSIENRNAATSRTTDDGQPIISATPTESISKTCKGIEPEEAVDFAYENSTDLPLRSQPENVCENRLKEKVPASSDRFEPGLLSIEKLKDQFGGDEAFAKQILQVMHETLPKQIARIQSASISHDFEQVADIAHQIKGAAGDSCLTAVYDAAAKLELLATNEDESNVPLTVAQLSRRSLDTIEMIEALINAS